jgi:hypothetical protein
MSNLIKTLEEWVAKSSSYGKNEYEEIKSLIQDERLFRLTKSMNIRFGNESKPVQTKKYFQTFALSDTNSNSEGDVHMLNQLISNIEREFLDKISSSIDEIVS